MTRIIYSCISEPNRGGERVVRFSLSPEIDSRPPPYWRDTWPGDFPVPVMVSDVAAGADTRLSCLSLTEPGDWEGTPVQSLLRPPRWAEGDDGWIDNLIRRSEEPDPY
jgi:hypothetical protein